MHIMASLMSLAVAQVVVNQVQKLAMIIDQQVFLPKPWMKQKCWQARFWLEHEIHKLGIKYLSSTKPYR